MADTHRWLTLLILLAACEAAIPAARAGSSASSSSGIVDVVLTADGHVVGLLLQNDGRPVEGAVGVLKQRGTTVSRTVTDNLGRYEFVGVRGGVYQLQVGDQARVIRAWDEATAPPVARPKLTLVRGDGVMRGQSGGPGFPRRTVGLGMIGLALGTITVIGIEATENDADNSLSLLTTPPGGMASP